MKTILVVDDEFASAEVLSLILEEEGYRVFCAANGRHGLDRVSEVRPELVILDFMMPIMNGAEMGKALRASEPFKGIAHPDEQQHVRAGRAPTLRRL